MGNELRDCRTGDAGTAQPVAGPAFKQVPSLIRGAHMVDAARLQESWTCVAERGDEVPLFFYSYLFLRCPETPRMFPPAMASQRDRLVDALGRIVAHVDRLDALVPFLEQLGREHRKFGVQAEHYPIVGSALLATLEHFVGDGWSEELAADWHAAYSVVSSVMAGAAQQAAATSPPWWEAEIVAHERRTLDIAVLTVRPEPRLDYLAGQSVTVETSLRPRLWRPYSPANAPRADGTIEFHVRAIDGGWVSSALVHSAGVGDVLRLGAPMGHRLTLNPSTEQDLLLVAGGTGLAPLRALVEQLAHESQAGWQVHLYVGARTQAELYDLPALDRLATEHPQLTVVPVISHDDSFPGERGTVADAVVRHGSWEHRDVLVCGSPAMVSATLERLTAAGIHPARVRHEPDTQGPYDDISTEAPAVVGLFASGGEHV